MRDALLIFRKDVRRPWPRVIPLLAITALLGWMECALFVINPILVTLRGVWLLSAAWLVASVIQEEQLPGHQQYWLTPALRLASSSCWPKHCSWRSSPVCRCWRSRLCRCP